MLDADQPTSEVVCIFNLGASAASLGMSRCGNNEWDSCLLQGCGPLEGCRKVQQRGATKRVYRDLQRAFVRPQQCTGQSSWHGCRVASQAHRLAASVQCAQCVCAHP